MRLGSSRLWTALMVVLGVGILSGSNCPQSVPPPPGEPAEFTNANTARGGRLYAKWWEENGATEPTGEHSRYPAVGQKTGSTTWRCKECHGWDYKGAAGAYGTGSSHFTGIKGLFGTTLDAQGAFDAIKAHAMTGLTDTDIWDLAKFVLGTDGAQFDTSTIIDASGAFPAGNATNGQTLYSSGIGTATACTVCHGADGKTINFGDTASPEFVGNVANDNPWEFQHFIRTGHPGTAMPATLTTGGTSQDVADVGTYAKTLPQS